MFSGPSVQAGAESRLAVATELLRLAEKRFFVAANNPREEKILDNISLFLDSEYALMGVRDRRRVYGGDGGQGVVQGERAVSGRVGS